MFYEKAWDRNKSIHSIWINTRDWALPLRITSFKTDQPLFEALVGKLLIFQIGFLCFSYRIERWWMGGDDENL